MCQLSLCACMVLLLVYEEKCSIHIKSVKENITFIFYELDMNAFNFLEMNLNVN